jgi:hypothetical protein
MQDRNDKTLSVVGEREDKLHVRPSRARLERSVLSSLRVHFLEAGPNDHSATMGVQKLAIYLGLGGLVLVPHSWL